MNDTRGPRLRPTGSLLVTKVRATQIRTACVTVLFADLRGYTGMVERLPAARVVPLLDEFFGALGNVAKQFAGEVYHMAGDGIMAGFGVHEENSNGAAEALAAGHAMLKSFGPLADRWHRELAIDAGIGIGMHLGEVAFGMLGPPRRKTTTLVGDTVNVAARLCSRARAGEVLFSCTVAAALSISAGATNGGTSTSFLQLPQFELRGRRGPIDIWCVPAPQRLAI